MNCSYSWSMHLSQRQIITHEHGVDKDKLLHMNTTMLRDILFIFFYLSKVRAQYVLVRVSC